MIGARDGDRRDATVLYLPGRFFEKCATPIGSLARELKADVPLFTKLLSRGIGLAESPSTGESFGMHRCRLIAEAIIESRRQGRDDVEARLMAAEDRFAAEGLSLARPYLNPGSEDIYKLPES
jgi:hypothetical protein